ncbi:MAG: GNAT family N-acetyltransferase [Chloroflexi bacterium]|nr:GNAT family N-acetyltransferase [Chloroflexota bacterium]
MQLKVLNSFPDELQADWDALLQVSASNVPFLRFGFLKSWWQNLGGGEWEQGELHIILGYDEEHLLGIAPFFITSQKGKKLLTLLGSVEISDYLDLIAAPADYPGFLNAVLNFLQQEDSLTWDTLRFSNIPQNSPLLSLFPQIALPPSYSRTLTKTQPAPMLALPGTWESYLENLDKKQRHEIRRKLRRLEQEAPDAQFYFVEDASELQSLALQFLDLMRYDEAKRSFLTPAMQQQMIELMQWAFTENILRLCFLDIHGSHAAAYFCFDDGETISIYNSGFDPALQYFSPGWVLLSDLIQWSIENSRARLDFMRGNEAYKYKFGALDNFIYQAVIEKTTQT